jgi:hypothetical protein
MFVGYKQIVAHYNYCDSNRTSVRVDGNTHNRIVIHRLVAGRVAVEEDRTNVRAGSEQPRKARWLGGAVVSVSSFATCSRGRRDYYRCGFFRSRHPHQPRNNPCEEWGEDKGSDPLPVKQRLPCARSPVLFVRVSATSPNDFSDSETRKPPPDATVLATLSRLTGRNPSRTVTPSGWFSYEGCPSALSLKDCLESLRRLVVWERVELPDGDSVGTLCGVHLIGFTRSVRPHSSQCPTT